MMLYHGYLIFAIVGGLAVPALLIRSLLRYTGPGWPGKKGQPNLTRSSNPVFFWGLTVWTAGGAILGAWLFIVAVYQLVHAPW